MANDDKQSKKEKSRFRLDLKIQVIESRDSDDGSSTITVAFIPDPGRYDTIEVDGRVAYRDKFTGYVIEKSVLEDAMTRMQQAPIYFAPAKKEYYQYLNDRRDELLKHWDEEQAAHDTRSEFLELIAGYRGKETQVAVLYVDMEGSTRLSSELDAETYSRIVKTFLMEMSNVVDNFNGYVYKLVGDCVIGIFQADVNSIGMSDNAIQAAMIMRSVVEDVINPIFDSKGLPRVGLHIGVDIGRVKVDIMGATDVATFDELIGYTMNLTAKIQAKSGHDGILLGRNLFEILHNSWQQYCDEEDMGKEWTARAPDGKDVYRVYRFNAKVKCKKLKEGE